MEFFWYDYETTGRWRMVDRPVQFGGIRTDENLNQISEPITLYCKPALDCLPQVRASLVHGIAPQKARRLGITEHAFAQQIHALLMRPGTCCVGYNAMRFDHTVTRFLFYRNLLDPYAWHSRDGNSKWDIIDLFRAAFALSPDGIQWHFADDDKPSFRLEDIAGANGVDISSAHDALADVRNMLRVAQLIKAAKPRMWSNFLGLRDKREVKRHVSANSTFLYVSGSVVHWRRGASIMMPIGSDDKGAVFAYDLFYDPRPLFDAPDEVLLEKDSLGDKALHRIRLNACPYVWKFDLDGVLTDRQTALMDRMGTKLETLLQHRALIRDKEDFGRRVADAFAARWPRDRERDVDQALYDGFIPRPDRPLLDRILNLVDEPGPRWEETPFKDERLPELVFRFRARNFPRSLSAEDETRWYQHCRHRIFESKDDKGLTQYEHYVKDLAEARMQCADEKTRKLIYDLEAYGKELEARLLD